MRKVQVMRTVLSAALTRAMREELVIRNVARLVELPEWKRGTDPALVGCRGEAVPRCCQV